MTGDFARDVLRGLTSVPKSIPPKWFYDEAGSRLYEEITRLPEYYLTRAGDEILERHAPEMVAAAGGFEDIVELGVGSSSKTFHLLRALRGRPVVFHAVDISRSALDTALPAIAREFGNVEPCPHLGEFVPVIRGIRSNLRGDALWLFLGSTIGNLDDAEAAEMMRTIRGAMAPGGRLLLGVDLVKEREVLERAYDDPAGVTARFNLNLLARINRELGGGFDLSRFRHIAFYNEKESRIEMHLESAEGHEVEIGGLGLRARFAAGERLHTENSRKYTNASVSELAEAASLRVERRWTDLRGWFAQYLLRPA